MNRYSQKHIDFLEANIKNTEKDLVKLFKSEFDIDLTIHIIGNLKRKYGLKSGLIGGQFKKGQPPSNKGKKWADFMSEEGQENSRKTQYKKGNINHNTTPVGTERVTKDGYIEIKCEKPRKTYKNSFSQYYRLKHRVIWEQANGKIPKGYVIIFADGNKSNFNLENLILISQAENVRLNQNNLRTNNADLTKSGVLVAKLLTAIGRRKSSK